MDEMLRAVNEYPNGTYLRIEWEDANVLLGGVIDTIYQTNNGHPEGTSTFREYYAFAFRIKDVIKNMSGNAYSENSLMEISMETPPTSITLRDERPVWKAW